MGAYPESGRAFQFVNAINHNDGVQVDYSLNKRLLDLGRMQGLYGGACLLICHTCG
jgi:hypothetical protein